MFLRARSRAVLVAAALAVPAVVAPFALASSATATADTSHRSFSYAVYGDAPYGTSPTDTSETAATPAFIDRVNADPLVSAVLHVGDIHSGSQYCTEAYDRQIAALWSHFARPMVYTPGDNEWADCHKKKEGGGSYDAPSGTIKYVTDPVTGDPVDYAQGNPVANLALIRSTFFPRAGATLGSGRLSVLSQAQAFDPAHPGDAAYVENVLWQRKGFVFVTLNLPGGSNNDTDPWYGTPSATAEQNDEVAARTGADLRWLDKAFSVARHSDAQGVVVLTQADMWDLDGKTAAHLSEYEPFIASLAGQTTTFGRPVLLLNGDSHVYRSDDPLEQSSACTGDQGVCATDAWTAHPSYDVPNFHRIVVHGSTTPLEYLRLTVTPGAHGPATATSVGPFSWQRITG